MVPRGLMIEFSRTRTVPKGDQSIKKVQRRSWKPMLERPCTQRKFRMQLEVQQGPHTSGQKSTFPSPTAGPSVVQKKQPSTNTGMYTLSERQGGGQGPTLPAQPAKSHLFPQSQPMPGVQHTTPLFPQPNGVDGGLKIDSLHHRPLTLYRQNVFMFLQLFNKQRKRKFL